MRILRMAGIGLAGLVGSPFRAALTTLGIVIGVFAVVLLMALGAGVQQQVTGQLDDLGTNLVQISPGSEESEGGLGGGDAASTLTVGDSERLADLPSVAAASPSISLVAPAEASTGPSRGGGAYAFTGVNPCYTEIRSVDLDAGRFVEGAGEVVLDGASAEKLLGIGPKAHGEAVGETVGIKGEDYEVVGVAKVAGGFAAGTSGATSYMVTDDALAISGAETVGQIEVRAESAESVGEAKKEVTAEIKAAHDGTKDFSVESQEDLLASFTQITDLLTYLLAGIAGISLLVGGIGVMNIMLVSVSERTREIGVRKALGATDADVLWQFLFEAVLLSLVGGLVGVGLGVGVAAILPTFSSNLPTLVTPASVGLAFGVSAAIGVVFGVLPAYRSARLTPVEALRRE